MRILLIGVTGQLGGDLVRNNPGHEILTPGRDDLDLERMPEAVALIEASHPEVVINCAAFHNVPACESDGERAFRINCLAVRDLARVSQKVGARFVTFSTDYVFDGDKRAPYLEHDLPRPLQVYGITRLSGECAALSQAPGQALVIRTCGLYGRSGASGKGGNFVDQRIAEAKGSASIEIGSDQTVCPTYTRDLSRSVYALLGLPGIAPGIYHLTNEGECTWFEFTKAIFEILGTGTRVVPVDRGGKTGEMRRPLYSVLGNSKAKRLGVSLPPWRDALRRYLQEKYAVGGVAARDH